jgi:hypothetical protein
LMLIFSNNTLSPPPPHKRTKTLFSFSEFIHSDLQSTLDGEAEGRHFGFHFKPWIKVAVISFPDVMKALAACDVSLEGVDIQAVINKFFLNMPVDRFHYILNETKVNIYRGIVGPNMLVYIPQGHVVFERVVGGMVAPVLGCRTALATSANGADMLAFVKAYSKGLPVEPLAKFWKTLLSIEVDENDLNQIPDIGESKPEDAPAAEQPLVA